MKRSAIILCFIIFAYILQTTVFGGELFGGIKPNLLIVIVSMLGFMRGRKTGLVVGFLSGLIVDIFSMEAIGFYMLFFMYIGFLNGLFHRHFFRENIKLPLLLIITSDFILNLAIFGLFFLLRGRFGFVNYLTNIMIPEICYTVLVALFLYPLLLIVNHQFDSDEKRRAGKLV